MLSCSDKFKQEYCCTVVRIGECFPIEGADRIQRTLVNGMDMVISKEIKPGDIMIYASNETQLNEEFIRVNNQFGIGDFELNSNAEEIRKLKNEGRDSEAKALCGFFNSSCRVKMLKLKGAYSFGFLFTPKFLANWMPETAKIDFNKLIGTDFDTVNGQLLVKVYIPRANEPKRQGTPQGPRGSKFDVLLDSHFPFHYDSGQLQRNIQRVKPSDVVAITVKVHGTSAVFSRMKCKLPKKLNFVQKAANFIGGLIGAKPYTDYTIGYDSLYSSRNVLKNRYRNPKNPEQLSSQDIWGVTNELIAPLLTDGMTVYGEIFGHFPGDTKFIQKDYDYRCDVGHFKFMPYRIVYQGYEYDVTEVADWTRMIIATHPLLSDVLYPMPVLYHGTLKDLYPEIAIDDHWHDNVLAAMKQDKALLGMEQNEPLCRNKVPREGVCLRIDKDLIAENFKLKCSKFLSKESASIDAGEIDMESLEAENV